jgi:putative DNA methylase
VQVAHEEVNRDALATGLSGSERSLEAGDDGSVSYADAIATYLAIAISRISSYWSNITTHDTSREKITSVFARQAIPMAWDFMEGNPFSGTSGNFFNSIEASIKSINQLRSTSFGITRQADASVQTIGEGKVISTDPPYYDNISYADLSDFFYIWLRSSLRKIYPDLFSTIVVPKAEELIATPYRHGGKDKAEVFFLEGMTQAMHRLAGQGHPAFPVTIYYAFKQAETEDEGTASTGWEIFLDAVIRAGLAVTGTWPMRTEMRGRALERSGINALASSIILVCRPRTSNAPTATRREFVTALKSELPEALKHLQRGNIAPVDLAQAAIGPGMGVYTRYRTVLDASGVSLKVRDALTLINQTLGEALAEQEGDFDADSRWALAWFELSGFADGEYGVAELLSKAKVTSIGGMADAGVLVQGRGKVRLLKPVELPQNWDPESNDRPMAWVMVHQLIRALEAGGENAAAVLVAKLGNKAEVARELAYRLYTICERKKRAQEASSYNGLVKSWPEIMRLAREGGAPRRKQTGLSARRWIS